MYLQIKSQGVIEDGAFTLIGASTKRNQEGKIGLYGSGNKYAIASLIRNRIGFKVFAGTKEISFTVSPKSFRDETFEMIMVNGKETSLTTQMGGVEWDTPFAPLREIYSNAIDEDEYASLEAVDRIVPEEGFTSIFIEMNSGIRHFYENINLYFCIKNKKCHYKSSRGAIYPNESKGEIRLFRKGILAYSDDNQKSVFHYNLYDIEINESRVLKSLYDGYWYAAYLIKGCTNKSVISSLINHLKDSNNGYFEHHIKWSNGYFSDEWFEVLQDKKLAPVEFSDMFTPEDLEGAIRLPHRLLQPLKLQFDELQVVGFGNKAGDIYVERTPPVTLTNKVIDAIAMLKKTKYQHRMEDLDIRYVKFQKSEIMAKAEDGKILLSLQLESSDVNAIAKVLIEENEHNITGLGDCTRSFQNHLFNLYFDALTTKTYERKAKAN